jgi:hypothetical protein
MFNASSSKATNTFLKRVAIERRALRALKRISGKSPAGLSAAALQRWLQKSGMPEATQAHALAVELSKAAGLDADKSMQVFACEQPNTDASTLLHKLEMLAA